MLRALESLVLMAALLLYSGCAHPYETPPGTIARIGNVPITQREFDQYVRSGWAGADMDEVRTNQAARTTTMESFFDLKVLAAKARQEGIDQEPTFQKASQLMEMKLLVQAITDRDRIKLLELAKDPTGAGKREYMETINTEVELIPTDLATNDAPLVLTGVIESNAVLATLDGSPILESDFQWFLRDAFRPEQRPYVFGQPGARIRLLNSYLSMRALEAKARKDGLDQEAAFMDMRSVMEDKLLAEFLLERDHMMPWHLGNDEASREKMRTYLDQLRTELDFKVVSISPTANSFYKSSSVSMDKREP